MSETIEEQFDRAVLDVVTAITNKGSHPDYHDKIQREHSSQWPVLWYALYEVIRIYRKKEKLK